MLRILKIVSFQNAAPCLLTIVPARVILFEIQYL